MKLISTFAVIFAAVALAAPPAPGPVLTDAEFLAKIQALHPEGNWTTVAPEGVPEIGPRQLRGISNWNCDELSRASVNQHGALGQIHKDFNKLFGNTRLTSAKYQAYIGTCRGYSFYLNNRSCCTRQEVSNARNLAAAMDPGVYTWCATHHWDDSAQIYYFKKVTKFNFGSSTTVSQRLC